MLGASHGVDLAFVFGSTNVGNDSSYVEISDLAQRSWIGFVVAQDPNANGMASAVHWPSYSEGLDGRGMNLVWDAIEGNHAENDTYREAGIAFINSISREFLA